ncbi:hypothetical protein KAH55_15280, partial [bacterium]|nr:hypothetical protein [bacterium]
LQADPDFSRLIQYCDETAGFPQAAQLTFTIPAVKPLKSWLSRTSSHKAEKFMKLVHAGRIEVAVFFNQPTMDLLNDEGLIRQLYAAEALRVQHQVPVTTATIDLEQGFTWGLADILPAAGISICFSNGTSDQQTGVCYRQGQAGRKLVCWQDSATLADFKFEADSIETQIKQLQHADYPFPALRIQLNSEPGQGSIALCKAVQKWNQEWAFPKLMLSTNSRFWAAIEKFVPENTPVLTGDAGSLTSPVAATAAAHDLSVARRAQAELKIAEKTAALASVFSSEPYPGLTLNSAYEEVLHFFEPPTKSAVALGSLFDAGQADKRHAAFSALGKAEAVNADALKELVARVPLENDGCHLVVFNPSERPQTDIVQADFISAVAPDHRLPAELAEQGFVLIDAASGDKILYQIDEVSDTSEAALQSSNRFALGQVEPAYLKKLVFVARDVPAMGFKVYALQPVDATEIRPKKVDMAVKTLENDFYRISVSANGGGVFSILDKELETDIMDGFAKNRLNQLFVRDGGRDSIHKLENVSLRREQRGAVSVSLIITGQAQGCPQVVQEITLYNDIKRIDFTNRILKDATPLQEVYFSFPFQVRDAKIQYPHGINILEPATGQIDGKLPAAQAIGDWVSITNETMGIAWSSPDAPIVRFS